MDERDRDSTVDRSGTETTAGPQASRTVRSSGGRGSGGGPGDAHGGARRASEAAGLELPNSAGDPQTPERDDPGGGADITGTTEPVRPDGTADPAASGLGETPAGATLEDYEQTLKRARDRRR